MATNLHDRANAQQALFDATRDAAQARLSDVRTESTRRHPNPTTVAIDDWSTALGADQHLQVAREALAANAAAQVVARAGLAGVTTPAEAGPQGAVLGDLLVTEARLRVEARTAAERVGVADSLIRDLGALVARAESDASAAAARSAWAAQHQTAGDRLRGAIAIPPLDTIVADASSALGAPMTAANDRLDTLLPGELRARAEARFDEAAARKSEAAEHLAAAEPLAAAREAASHPLDAAVDAAERDLLAAETALDAYASRAAGQLDTAVDAFTAVANVPDLGASQVAALDPSGRTEAIAAASAEADVAIAVHDVAVAQRAVDDAILAAVGTDPDADPETDAAVIAARATLEGAALQDALTNARNAYDTAARGALDAWEVEVPPELWDALSRFLDSRRSIQGLADHAARDALVTALDDASDALASALDERDVATRGDLQTERQRAERLAVTRALDATAAARSRSYTRGDGPSGRTAAEL
jgi:hypothetical protein